MGLSTRRKNSCEGGNSRFRRIHESRPGNTLIPWKLSAASPRDAILEVDRDGQFPDGYRSGRRAAGRRTRGPSRPRSVASQGRTDRAGSATPTAKDPPATPATSAPRARHTHRSGNDGVSDITRRGRSVAGPPAWVDITYAIKSKKLLILQQATEEADESCEA